MDAQVAMLSPDGAGGWTTHYYLRDHLGSVLALVDASGAVAESYEYAPYGQPTILAIDGVGVRTVASSPAGNRFLYTGREWEPEAGHYHYRHRTYHPTDRRFMQADPIGLGGGWNHYAYVGGNPVMASDPMGLFTGEWGDDLADFVFDPDSAPFASSKFTGLDEFYHLNSAYLTAYAGAASYQGARMGEGALLGSAFGGGWRASFMLQHYLGGSGAPVQLGDCSSNVLHNTAARNAIALPMWNFVRQAQAGGSGNFVFQPAPYEGSNGVYVGPYSTVGMVDDWYYAVGGFYARGWGTISPHGEMTVTIQLADRYNFHKNGASAFGILFDADMARLHEVGWAQAFDVDLGTYTYNLGSVYSIEGSAHLADLLRSPACSR